jgi:ribosomal protein S18 acetylase RimI-like enzyme
MGDRKKQAAMIEQTSVQLLPLEENFRDWARDILNQTWGMPLVVSRGRLHDASKLPGYVAVQGDEPVGLTTYHIVGDECELVTLNSLRPKLGIGSALVAAVKEMAINAGCRRLWLITTNDNTLAIRFYQQRGFRLAALHIDALKESRRLKPQIPLVGEDGIPIRDELEFEIILKS